MGIASAECEKKDLMTVRSGALVANNILYIIWSTPTNIKLETARLIFFKI